MYDNDLAVKVWRGEVGLQRFHGFRMPPGYPFISRW